MRLTGILAICLLLWLSSCNGKKEIVADEKEWPIIRSYDQNHLSRIALPLGGIGTGTISMSGSGEFFDWKIQDNPGNNPEGIVTKAPFFTIFTTGETEIPKSKILIGPDSLEYKGVSECIMSLLGLKGFEKSSFDAAYPFGQVHLSDSKMPVDVTIKAFNPLAPCELLLSGLPIAILDYEVRNNTDKDIIVSIAGTMRNCERNVFRNSGYYKGIFISPDSTLQPDSLGSFALAALGEKKVFYQQFTAMNDFRSDFSDDGELKEVFNAGDNFIASIAIKDTLPAGNVRSFRFMLSWYVPVKSDSLAGEIEGNQYASVFTDAWNIIEETGPFLLSLEKQTILFVRTLMNSDLPVQVIEAALFNLSGLRSKENTSAEKYYQGLSDDNLPYFNGWNYEQASPFLFGSLSKTMREAELHATENKKPLNLLTAENQMATIIKFYRDWQLSGDSALISEYWPEIKSIINSLWTTPGMDDDKDGVIGNNKSGYNPKTQILYLCALRATQKISAQLNDPDILSRTGELFVTGSEWTDANLFNGEYYEQKTNNNDDHSKACFVDQLAGQYMAQICGLGYLLKEENVRKSYKSIIKYNSSSINNEPGLIVAGMADKSSSKTPPYFSEIISGNEYAVATGMVFAGMRKEGLNIIDDIRARHDGLNRNPFNQGGGEGLAAWAPVFALTGFQYSGVDKIMSIKLNTGSTFWSTGYAWGSVTIKGKGKVKDVTINVYGGKLLLKEFILNGFGKRITGEKNSLIISEGQNYGFSIIKDNMN